MSAGGLDQERRRTRIVFVIVLGVALLLRVPASAYELFHHPDEIWQYLEPAHGLVTGHAIVPWEYRAGIRTWLVPTMLAAPMALGKMLWPESLLYLFPVRLFMAVLSLSIVGFGAAIAARISRGHALAAGLALATSLELVYFAPRALSDSLAPVLFMPAAWLLLPHPGRTIRGGFVAGLLLGLCFAVRFQLAPALGVLVILTCGRQGRLWLAVIAGGLAGLLIDGATDLAQGAEPFRWVAENFEINLVQNKSAFYGTEAPLWYLANQIRVWGLAFPLIAGLALLGARRQPILAIVAFANVAAHMAIPHKEYRFIFLSVVIATWLAGIGLADALALIEARRDPFRRGVLAAGMIGLWIAIAAALATAPANDIWSTGRRTRELMRAAHDVPGVCAIAFFQPPSALAASYTYYDRATPVYVFRRDDAFRDIRRLDRAFDVVITSPDRAAQLDPAFHEAGCFEPRSKGPITMRPLAPWCMFVRPGGCSATLGASYRMNAALGRSGE